MILLIHKEFTVWNDFGLKEIQNVYFTEGPALVIFWYQYTWMLPIRNTGLFFILLLITWLRIFAPTTSLVSRSNIDFSSTTESQPNSKIQNPYSDCYYEAEPRNLSQPIFYGYGLDFLTILSNRIVPRNNNLKGAVFLSVSESVLSLVPIFIMGHALLN